MNHGPLAIVTGGTRPGRVGIAIASALARAGCDLLLTRRGPSVENDEPLQFIRQLGVAVRIDSIDLDNPDAAGTWAARLAAELPRVDILVHNASTYEQSPLGEIDAAEALRAYRVNALSPLLISQAFAGRLAQSPLPGGGSIIAMADIHAMGELGQPRRQLACYAMSKAALLEMMLVLARELAPRVRVNAVAPGVVAFAPAGPDADPAMQQTYLKRVPLARSGTPAEAAEAVRWLALDATYCTGQVIRVDGGRAIT